MANSEQEPVFKSPIQTVEYEITQHLKGAEFGSPQLLAFGDVYQEDRLRRLWLHQSQDLVESSPEDRPKSESALRITELEMAIINRQIANRETEVKGYGHHYLFFMDKWYHS